MKSSRTIEKFRSVFIAVCIVSLLAFAILYLFSLLLPKIGILKSDINTIPEAGWLDLILKLNPYLFFLSIFSMIIIFVIDISTSIYKFRLKIDEFYLNYSYYERWINLCRNVIYAVSIIFFIILTIHVIIYMSLTKADFDMNVYLSGTAYVINVSFWFSLIILFISTITIISLKLTEKIKLYRLIKHNESAYNKYSFLLDINKDQYINILEIICAAGKEPKTKKSNYDGANRDSVSNCLIALNNRGKMEAVCRENVLEVVLWLENINGLDAHFSENIDDFLEKFSLVSELRLKRISAIERQMEKYGI